MRYISEQNISFSLDVKGFDKRFRFTPCMDCGSIYVTDDVDEIEALEQSEMYNRVYKRHPSCVDEQVETSAKGKKKASKKASDSKEVPEVTNWQEAKEYLVANCGADETSVCNPEGILEAAKQNKVSFPNLEQ